MATTNHTRRPGPRAADIVRVVVIIAVALLAAGLAWLLRSQDDDRYESRATYALGPSPALDGGDPQDVIDTVRAVAEPSTVATISELVSSDVVVEEAATELGLDPSTLDSYDVSAPEVIGSFLIELRVSGPDPRVAQALASEVGARSTLLVGEVFEIFAITEIEPAGLSGSPASPKPTRDAAAVFAVVAVLMAILLYRPLLRRAL